MKRFVANLNDGSFVNVTADRMQIQDNGIFVYCGQEPVAYLDISCVLMARLDENGDK